MRDVANLAGVSVMTVSRALHDDARITDETKGRVRTAVEQLGYLRNDTARNLRIGRGAEAVGLVIGNLANPFYSQLALGIGEVAEQHGLTVMFVNAGRDVEREARASSSRRKATTTDTWLRGQCTGHRSCSSPARPPVSRQTAYLSMISPGLRKRRAD
jgi:DNA-binding LacI/PurR family transcriptional regulator